jgi:flagellar hook-associated protein FlgK
MLTNELTKTYEQVKEDLQSEVDKLNALILDLKRKNMQVEGLVGPGENKFTNLGQWVNWTHNNTRTTFQEIIGDIE